MIGISYDTIPGMMITADARHNVVFNVAIYTEATPTCRKPKRWASGSISCVNVTNSFISFLRHAVQGTLFEGSVFSLDGVASSEAEDVHVQCKRCFFTGGQSMKNIDGFHAGDMGVVCDLVFETCTIDDVVISWTT